MTDSAPANVPLHILGKIAQSSIANIIVVSTGIACLSFHSRGACVKTVTQESIVSIWIVSIIAHFPMEYATVTRESVAATRYSLHIIEPSRGLHGKVPTAVICRRGPVPHPLPHRSH